MSKAEKRAAAAATLTQAAEAEGLPPQAVAMVTMLTDMLDSLERIAGALEKMAGSQALRDTAQNR